MKMGNIILQERIEFTCLVVRGGVVTILPHRIPDAITLSTCTFLREAFSEVNGHYYPQTHWNSPFFKWFMSSSPLFYISMYIHVHAHTQAVFNTQTEHSA